MTLFYIILVALCILFQDTNCKQRDILKASEELLEKETARLKSLGGACTAAQLDLQALDSLRVNKQFEALLPCCLKYLSINPQSGWAWSILALTYHALRLKPASLTCYKQASKLDGPVSSFPRGWHFLGPFVVGKSEFDGDPVAGLGGIHNLSVTRFQKSFHAFSELAPAGEIAWLAIAAPRKNEYARVGVDGIDWGDLVNSLGSTGITEWQGWVVGAYAVNSDARDRYVGLRCLGVSTVYVEGVPVVGDVYRREQFRFAVAATKGIHEVQIRARSKGPLGFRCDVESISDAFEVLRPTFLPDLYAGRLFSAHFHLPIVNYMFDKKLKILKVTVIEQPTTSSLKIVMAEDLAILAPGQVRPISCQITSEAEFVSEACEDVYLKLKILTSEGHVIFGLTLACRKESESVIFTFFDVDGSLQHGAAIRPLEECDNEGGACPVLLSLHGTTVPARSQADSYKRMVSKEFIFGAERAWVLAPTRHGAHNWEGPGALTALSALRALAELTETHNWIVRKASAEHVIFAGHSMGGHGAWHLATHFPDLALAVVSLAGWIKKEEYGDSNLLFRHDIATSHVEPGVKSVMEKCIAENNADRHVSNLRGVPVMMRIGARDRTVHPYYTRRMYRLLRESGVNVTYVELADKEHWWWDTRQTNDGGCMNDEQLRVFVNSHAAINPVILDPQHDSEASQCTKLDDDCAIASHTKASIYQRSVEEEFKYVVINPALAGSMRGVRVIVQEVPMLQSQVHVLVRLDSVQLLSRNVRVLELYSAKLRPVDYRKNALMLDGQEIELRDSGRQTSDGLTYCFCKNLSTWTWASCEICSNPEGSGLRGPATIGPARRIAEQKFIIVTGSQISNRTKELEALAVYVANLFFLTSDASAPIMQDNELTDELAAQYNLIVIGNPEENLLTQKFLNRVPLTFKEGSLQLGRCRYDDVRSGALFLAPHAVGHLAVVLMGTSVEGLRDVIGLATPTIPPMTRSPFSNMVPDFVVTGPDYPSYGPGGYHCTGFWGSSWDLRPELISCPQCV